MQIQHFFELIDCPCFNDSLILTIPHLYTSLWKAELIDTSPAVVLFIFFPVSKSSLSNFSSPFIALHTAIRSRLSLLYSKIV
ncbi:hypothetical protein E2C01_038417 [Portunus trituberculatus]|uniref:Uncharacterized protein n=1 Tax=Portunus trituberculatus TaxID=210409 RepID=A0A5B7FGS1_PORTR|nr:hypothetical protein [Portunus trituberculatus]